MDNWTNPEKLSQSGLLFNLTPSPKSQEQSWIDLNHGTSTGKLQQLKSNLSDEEYSLLSQSQIDDVSLSHSTSNNDNNNSDLRKWIWFLSGALLSGLSFSLGYLVGKWNTIDAPFFTFNDMLF